MAAGYLGGDCVQAQIDATVDSAIEFARSQINNSGESFKFCDECGDEIPERRRQVVKGCRYCLICQTKYDAKINAGYNRRGSKDSQLR